MLAITIVSPAEEYRQRLARRDAEVSRFDKLNARVGTVRLLLGISIIVALLFAFTPRVAPLIWLAASIAAFAGVVVYHRSVRSGRDRSARAAAFYRNRIARIEDRWMGTGSSGERFEAPHHVYAADLDLFGKGSVFELLSTARTRMGEDTLAGWLLAPAPAGDDSERHAASPICAAALDLREDLAMLAEQSTAGVHPEALLAWAAAPQRARAGLAPSVRVALPLLALGGAVVWVVWDSRRLFCWSSRSKRGAHALKAQWESSDPRHGECFRRCQAVRRRCCCGWSRSRSPRRRCSALIGRLSLARATGVRDRSRALGTVVSFVEARRNPFSRCSRFR